MRILINGRFLIPGKLEGIGLYTFEIVQILAQSHPDVQFILCVDRIASTQFDFGSNVEYELIRPPARHPFLFYWWFEIGIPRAFRKHRADLFFSPDGFCSLQKSIGKTLLVIHDLAYLYYPQQVRPLVRWYYKFFTPRFIQKADYIVAVSKATHDDIVTHFPIAAHKTGMIYNGVRSAINNQLADDRGPFWKKSLQDRPYFMSLGSIHPRKNLKTVLNAFSLFKQTDYKDTMLLVVGRMAWKTSDIKEAYESHPNKDQIIFTGYLSDNQMFSALQGCQALIYISLFEGFGLPIVEAMANGIPVITSNQSSMKEIAADAGLLVNPLNEKEVADAMTELNENQMFRSSLITSGYQRAKSFSWSESAAQTWEIIKELTSG